MYRLDTTPIFSTSFTTFTSSTFATPLQENVEYKTVAWSVGYSDLIGTTHTLYINPLTLLEL